MTTVAEATRQYQLALEHQRRDPDDDDRNQDLDNAERALTVAWLEYATQ